ncbi:MAG: YiiD C-terminal domain-containing protein [Gammaproteobacteria bacterium]|nr:YiiD C-terminal domain-containing protein [Gammaproteobacteria bacterium]
MADHRTDLQNKIHAAIPMSQAMQFSIKKLSSRSILVHAPLAPNVNIHGTGFAGSIYSIAVLAGWALSTHIMDVLAMDGDLVVSKAEISYRAPITGTIECRAVASEAECREFQDYFNQTGKGRLSLTIEVGDAPHAILLGTFYAVARACGE